jgi:hypothetical protein
MRRPRRDRFPTRLRGGLDQEHQVVVNNEMDEYAIVFFEALLPVR